MNEAARKAVEDALATAKGSISNSQLEIDALEEALETAKSNRESNERIIVELTAELEIEETEESS